MHASEVTPEAAARANELYWKSGRSVNQIAETLDLSKGALYGIIAPEPSGLGCPLCGDQVGYPNRTAKERELLDCATCDWDGGVDEAVAFHVEAGGSVDSGDRSAPPVRGNGAQPLEDDGDDDRGDDDAGPLTPTPPPPLLTPRLNHVAGGALLGAAVGLALVLWARRR